MDILTEFKNIFKRFISCVFPGLIRKDARNFWKASLKDEDVRSLSHWCGTGAWEEEKWHKFGEFYRELICRYFQKYDKNFSAVMKNKVALEWGPGGGVNVRVLCDMFRLVHGVDISNANLEECHKKMTELGKINFIPHVLMDGKGLVFEHSSEKFDEIDFMLCVAVFQHMTSKHYVADVLKKMYSLMSARSYALFQTRYYDGSPQLKSKTIDYKKNVVTFLAFETDEFVDLLKLAGFELLCSEKDIDLEKSNYEFFFCKKVLS